MAGPGSRWAASALLHSVPTRWASCGTSCSPAISTALGGGTTNWSPISASAMSTIWSRTSSIERKLKVVAACGNGTAGAFAPQVLEAHRLRSHSARRRTRPHLPALQSEPRRHGDAARDPRRGAGTRRRCRARLRRRRRPLRRRRQQRQRDLRRQGGRHAGARHLSAQRQAACSSST